MHKWWYIIIGAGALLYMIVWRVLGVAQTYHQDEHRWALAVDPMFAMLSAIPHPPLAREVYHIVGGLVSYELLRIVPILLGMVTLALIFVYVRRWHGLHAAIASLVVYSVTTYVLVGALQIDIDGSFLPLLTLTAFLGYLFFREGKKRLGLSILIVSLILGFSTKLSFVLVPGAILIEHVLYSQQFRAFLLHPRTIFLGSGVGALGILSTFFFLGDVRFISYVKNFISLANRDYVQVFFQSAKVLIYLSPLIPVAIILGLRHIKELRFWYVFLGVNILFYFVVFDFTHRTFDRYLMFVILPGVIIASAVIAAMYAHLQKRVVMTSLGISAVVSMLILHVVGGLPHLALPLIPKDGFVNAVMSGELNILLPLSGGSGPLGFYVPVDGMLLLLVLGGLSGFALFWVKNIKAASIMLGVFLGVSLTQSFFVTNEYIRGTYYGSPYTVVNELLTFIDENIEKDMLVLSYNDIAAYELYTMGRYGGRFYPHPEFIQNNATRLAEFPGIFFVVNMPRLNDSSSYGLFFAQCKALAYAEDGHINGYLYECDADAREFLKAFSKEGR